MERLNHVDNDSHRAEFADGEDLERRLAVAEQRYAAAREDYDKARAELRELNSRKNVNPQLVQSARGRLEAVVARCARLRTLIDQLEDQLD